MNPAVVTTVKSFGRLLSATRGPRLSILIFHRVLPKHDPLMPSEPDAAAFRARMKWLASAFRVLPLTEAARRLRDGSLPPNAACITFDDGYADNLLVAAPILADLRLSATFFVATGFLDGGRMFNDTVIESVRLCRDAVLDLASIDCGTWSCADDAARRATIGGLLDRIKYLPQGERQAKVDAIADHVGLAKRSDLMMTRQQVRDLKRHGMSIGAHTVTHPILTTLPAQQARDEIAEGRAELQGILGEPVKVFAYPNGKPGHDFDQSHVRMVRDLGFEAAVTTARGVSDRHSDRHQLARFTPWDRGATKFGLRLAMNLLQPVTPSCPS